MDTTQLRASLEFALEAVWQAGRITLGYFQTGIAVERKGDHSPVTVADRKAEQKLRELIQRYWPEHGIWGEEFGQQSGQTAYTWIIDPIDGTKSFVQGVPLYGMLVALSDGQRPIVGVAHFPALSETIYAAQGFGCYWNGRRCHVSEVRELKDAVLLASEIDAFAQHGRQRAWDALIQATYIQRTWGDAYGHALVATGRAEIMLDPVMKVWDNGPFQVILEEAGGTFTDWDGKPTIYSANAIATNSWLFEPVMQIVRGCSD